MGADAGGGRRQRPAHAHRQQRLELPLRCSQYGARWHGQGEAGHVQTDRE